MTRYSTLSPSARKAEPFMTASSKPQVSCVTLKVAAINALLKWYKDEKCCASAHGYEMEDEPLEFSPFREALRESKPSESPDLQAVAEEIVDHVLFDGTSYIPDDPEKQPMLDTLFKVMRFTAISKVTAILERMARR